MLRLHNRAMSDRAIPERFHRIPRSPLPPFPSPGARAGAEARGPSGPGFPPGGGAASQRPPLHLGLRRQMLQLFLILSGGVNPRPALPVPPSPSPLGSCPPSCGEANSSQDSGRGERPGLGLEGRGEEKGKAEAREIRRREK